jgi:hypothetical protein
VVRRIPEISVPTVSAAQVRDLVDAGNGLEARCSLLTRSCAALVDSVEALTGKLNQAEARPPLFADPRTCKLETAGGIAGGVALAITLKQLRQFIRRR